MLALAKKEQPAVLQTMKELVEIESGSADYEGLEKIAGVIAGRLTQLGAKTDLLEAGPEVYKMFDTPERIGRMVRATFTGTGQGIAIILHTLAMLRALNFRDYGTLTVLINGDEEISSPGSRFLITRLGGKHDAVLSFQGGGGPQVDQIRLATSGIGAATITVRGRASHAGSAPHLGVNALYEVAHQVLENKLLPEAQVELDFERRRPPLQATDASRALGAHAVGVYAELGQKLDLRDRPTGGGTDAAFAALSTKAPVVEGFGLRGFGSHSTNADYILIPSIEPRLYLATRMIMDISIGKAPL